MVDKQGTLKTVLNNFKTMTNDKKATDLAIYFDKGNCACYIMTECSVII